MAYIDDAKTITEIEPSVSTGLGSGLWLPDIMQIRNPRLVRALKASFDRLSIAYHENSPVDEIIIKDDKVIGVKTGSDVLTADKVIIASGAWSAQFNITRSSVDVMPVKGQMIMYRGEPDELRRIILSEGHYVIPRKDGRILAGSTLEKIGFDKTISSSAYDELHDAAISLVPKLADMPIERQWAGLRPGTEKGIPYVCRHDEIEGLYIHAGHYRNGIVLGAASAELMADIVMESEPWCDIDPYRIDADH